jgi:type IV secretory pathway VirB2 component (pilin)
MSPGEETRRGALTFDGRHHPAAQGRLNALGFQQTHAACRGNRNMKPVQTPSVSGALCRFFSGPCRKFKLVACLAILPVFFTTGCTKEFRVGLAAQESIHVGDTVILDGQEVGKVTAIENDGEKNVAVVSIARADAARIVVGTEREAREGLHLTTRPAKPGAPPLAAGKFIPTPSTVKPIPQSIATLLDRLRGWNSHPRAKVVAIVVVLVLGIGLLIGRLTLRFLIGLVFMLVAVGFAANAALSAPTRKAEIDRNLSERIEAWTDRAEDGLADAKRHVDAGLTSIADHVATEAFMYCELANLADEQTRVDLRRMSVFTSAETKAALRNRYDGAASKRARMEMELVQLKLPSLRLFLLNRSLIRSALARDASAGIPDLLQRLGKLVKLPDVVTTSRLVTTANVNDVRFEGGKLILPDGTEFRTAQPAPALKDPTPRIAEVERVSANLKEALSILEEKVARPAPHQVHTLIVTLPAGPPIEPPVAAAPEVEAPTPAIQSKSVLPPPVAESAVTLSPTPTPTATRTPIFTPAPELQPAVSSTITPNVEVSSKVSPKWQGMAALGALVAVVAGIAVTRPRGSYEVTLARILPDGDAVSHHLTVHPVDEQIVLGRGNGPQVEPADASREVPAAISITRLGHARISGGNSRLKVRGQPVEAGAAIEIGDELEVDSTAQVGAVKYVLRNLSRATSEQEITTLN